MQESELNDALSRMRLQLLKEGHFSQLPGQQRDGAIASQGLGLPQQLPQSWGPVLQSTSSSPNSWLPEGNGLLQAPANRVATDRTQPMPLSVAGSSDGWTSTAGPQLGNADLPKQGNGIWGGGLFANDSSSIWSAGEPSPYAGCSQNCFCQA